MDVIDSHMENLSSQEVDDDEVSRNNEEDDDYNCCQNGDDDDDGDCSGWYQHHNEAGDYNGWYQYHDEAGDYNSWYQHHEEDDEHNGLDQQYGPVQNCYLAADNHDHALNLTLNEAPSKNLNQNQPEEVAHTENLLAADNDDPIQNFLAANNHHPIQNFLAADNHNHNHACFCAFSRFLVLETAYLYDLLFLEFASFLLIEELEDKQRLIQKKITKLEQKLEDYKREMDVIDSHMENLSSQEVDDDEVSRNNEEDDDYNCCQNDDDDDDGDCSGWYQHHDEAGDYNGWYQYHDEAGDYNSWYQHHEEDDEHNGLDQQYAPVQNLYLAADNHDHALNLTLNEAPSKNLNQNQPEEVAHTENLFAADNDDPIQNFLAANNHHPIQNFLAADIHNHNHACFCAFSRFLVVETAYLYDLLFLEFAKVDDDEVSRNNEEDDDYNCCQNDDDDDDGDCSGWYQHHDEAGDYNGWYQYHDEAGDYNSWYQHHEEDDEHNELDQQYAPVQNLYLAADNHDHALNLTLNEAPSKNLNQNQPEEVAHTENLLAADNDDPIQNFLAANNHHPIQNFLAADNHNHNHACFCAFSRFLVLETAYLYDLLFLEFASFLLIEELEDKQRLIQKKITKLEQKLEDYKREMDVIDSHMENLSSQEVDDDEVSRNNEEDDDYNCCQNDDDDDDGDCSGWYQHHDEAGDYNGWYQYHDEAGDYNSWYQHHEEDDEHNGLDQQYAPVQNLYLAADNHDHALNLTLNEAPSKNLNQNQPEEVAHTENLLAADNDDPIQNFLAANNHHPIQNFLAADNHNQNHACFCAFSRFLVLETAYLYDLLFLEFASFLLIEELEDKQRLIQKKITKLEQKLEDYKREMDVIDSHMENLSSQEVDDDEVSRNNEEDDDYNCCQNDDDDDDGDCSGWYQHHDEAGDYNGWYQYHDEAGDYNSWYQHHEEDDEHNGLDQQYAPVQNLYLAADNHDHALNLTLNEAPSKNLNQNQPEEVAHTENLFAADNDDPIQNFLTANNHHPIQNFLAADIHNHNHACFCAFSRFLVVETAYLYDLLFLEFAKVDDDEVSRNNEEDDDYNCCQNDDDDDDGDCSGWYQHHDEAGDYNGWYQYHDEAGDYNSWYQHHEEDDEHNELDQQYAPVQNLYLAADNHDHALNLTLNEAPSKNLNQNQPEEVAHTENLLAADNDDPIQNFLAANNHHPIQNFLAADNHNHNHACFCAFSRFLVLETAYLYDLLFLEFASFLLIEELEDKQRLIQKKITKLEQKLEDYKREMDVIDSHMENLSSQEVDDDEVSRNNEEDDDYNCCQNDDDDDDGDCSGWYQHHDEAGDYNGWYQYHDEAGDYNSWYQHHEEDDEHNGLDQQYAPVQNLYLAADNHDHALNLTLNEAPSKNLNQNQPEEVAHTENLLAADNDDPIQNFLAANNHHPIQNFLAADNHNHNHACFCAFSRFLVLETAYLYDLLFLEFAKVDDDEVSRNNEEDDDYNCCQNDDDDDDGDCSGWYQHHDEAGDYNGWYQYHDEAGDYNSWYQHHEEDDEHNGLDQQYAPVQNLYLAADNHDHALNLTLNEAPSKNLNQNQPEEVAHTENLLAADNDDPIQNFLAANNHHPIQNFLAADNHNHNHACFCAFSRFLVLETAYLYDLLFLEFASFLLIEELEDKQRLIQKKITKLEQKLEDYKREMDVIDSHMENLSSQEVDDDEVSRNNEEDDDYNCCQNDDDDDDGDCSGWYQHHDEAGDYNGWYQYHDEAGDYNSWYQHHEEDDEHNGLDQQYAPVQNLYLAADNHDHALNLTLNEAPSKNLNQNQPEEVAHTENLLAADNDDPIQNFLAANNHHPIQNFLAADNHNHNHACFCAFSRFLVLETAYLYDLLFLEFAKVDDDEVSRNNEEDDDYNCCQNDDDDDDGDCSGWYQHHDEAGDYNGWYQYHDEAGDYNSWYQHHEEDDEHNGLDQQYAPVQNLYLAADNHDHALNLTLNEAPSKNLNQNQPEEVAHTENLLAADNDDPIQNFLAANNHHPIQNFLAADNHNHNHACFCAFSRFLVLETAYLYDLLFLEFASFLLIEELEDKQRLIQKKITKLEQKLEDYKREMDVIDSHMENLSSQEVDDDEVSRNNEEDDDYNCCQNDDDDDDGDCSGWYQHHDEAGDYNGWYQYHDEAGDYNSWYQHHEEDDEHNGLDQQYAPVQNLYLAADNHDHALNLTLNEAPSKNLNQNQPEEVAHTENLLAADNDDPIQNFLAANNHHPIQNFLAADNHNHNHACFCAFSRFLVLETAYLYDLLFLEFASFLLIEELEDKQRLIQKKITKLEQKLEDYKREMDVIDSHMENLSSQEVDDDEVSRNNEEDDDYNCCQNDDDDDDGDCSGWYQHHDEAGDYNGWYQYHDEAGDYNSWYQHHEEDDEHNGLDQQYAPVQNLYLAADNHDHALNLTLNEAPSKNLNQNQPEEVAHTENLLAADNDDPIQNFLAANNHHPIQNFLAADNHNHNHACFCAFSRFLVLETAYLYDLLFLEFASFLLIEELEDKQRLIQKKITKLEQKLEDYKREMDVIDSHMENLSSQEVDDDEVSRNNEEDDDYNCCQNDDDDDDGDCSGWYQHHDEAGDYNGWYQYHDEAGDYNSWYQHHEEDDEHNGLDQQYAPVQNLYLAADNHDHALNLTLNEAPSKNLNQNQPEEVAHTENLLAADNDDPIQNFLAANNHHPIQNFLAADNHNHNHACFCAFSRFLVLETAYLYDLLFLEFASFLLIEELEDKQRLIQKKITKLEQKLEDYKREMDVIDSHMENLSSQEVDDDEVSRNNEEDDDYNCCQNDDDDDDGDCSGWYQHHDEAGDYNGWYQYHDEAGDYNSWYQHHEEDDEHNGLDQQYAPVQNLYLAADNHDHALNLTLNEAPSKNLNQNQPEEVAHTENLLAADNDDPIQNFLAANNHHPIQNFLAADNHNHNHACFCAFSRFLVLETAYLYDLLFLEFASFLLIEELEDKQRLIQKNITKLEQKLEDYKREMDVIDSHMENLSSQEVDDDEVSRNNEEDDDYNCCQNDDDDDDGDCSGWYQHHDEAGDYNGWYQYHDEAGDYNSWYQHHEEDDEHNGLDQQYAPVQNLYLAADNHDHALNLTLNEAPSKNLNQNQPEEVAHTENLLAADNDDPIQNFLAANNHHPIQNFLAADNHNHNHACFCAFSRFLVLETAYLYDLLFLEFASFLLIEELEDKQRLIQKKITKLEQKLEDYKREMDVIDSHMENLSSQEVDDDEVSRNNEEDDDYNCCQNDDDDDDGDCSGWYQHHDEAGDYNGWYQYHDEAGDYNSWYQHHEEDDEHNGLDQQYAPVQNLYLAADNHDHALNLTLNEAPSKNLNQNQPEEVAHTENLLAADNDDPIQNFLAANNHHPIQNFLAADNHNHNHACFCAFSRFLVLETAYLYDLLFLEFASFLLIEELEDKQRLIQKKITKLEQKLEDYKREMDVIDSHMENLSSQEVDDDEVSRNNEEDDDYNCCQNDDDDDDGDCSGWYQHHDEAGDYNGWYQYHDEAGDYNSWYQHHEEDDEHNGLDQQYAPVQNLYLAADNHDHALNLTLNEAPSKNLNQNQPEEVAHTENLLAADNDDPIQNFLAANNHHPIQNFLAADNHNHNHACFCAFSRFLVLETAYLYDLLFLEFAKVDDDEVSRNNEEDDDYNCCQNDDDDDEGDCSGWYQHHDEAGDYNGWYQYHDEAGDYNSWYQHHEEDDEHNGLDQQYAPVQNLYLAADNHDHALNLTLNEAPSKNLNQNQPEEVAHTENLLAADNDDPIQNFLAANNHHPIQNFLAADNHNHNHACFCAFSRFLVLETAYLYDLLFLEFASFLLIEELEDKQRLIQKKITKLEQKLEDYKREMDVIDSHMENLSSQEVDDDEVSRNNEEDDDYNCCQNDDDDDDGDCSGWYQHHDEAGDYNGWYQYHDEAGDYNSWYQHHEEDDEHNGLDQQYAPVQNLYLAADNHDHALNLTLNEAPSKNLNQNQPEEVAHTENLLAADNDDPIQNFLAANNHHPIQNFLAADNHNHNHACFCAFSRFLVLETAYLYDLLFLEFASFLLIEELEDKQRLIQKKITKLEQKLEDYKREMDVIDSHMENLSSQEVDDDEVSRNNEEDDDYNCCQNDDDDDDGDCSGWYQHHDEAGDYNGWYQYHDEAGDYNSWYQHHEEDDEHNGLDQQYAPVQNLYLAADNHDHALNLTLNEAPSKNLNQNQPEEVAHTENLLAADNDDPIQNFLAANNHHPIQNFLAADNHNHNHACFCAFSRFLVLETAYLYDLLFLEFASFLLIEELEDKQRLIQKKITKLEQKLEDYKREMDVIDSHMENLSSQEVDDDEVSRNNEEDDDYNCCQNDDDDDDGDCSGWYQHHDEAGDYNGWYQYHDEAGDYNSWYQHHEEDDEHNGLDQQYAPVQNLYLAADNHDHALNLTLNEAPSKNLNQNQPEEVAHTENLLAADNDDPIQNFLAANNHHPIQNFLAADNHNHNHACFCAFSRFLVLETAYLYDLLFLEFASFLLIEELEDKQRLIQKKITKLEQKLEDYKREMDVIDSHMENLSSQEVDDDEVSRNNEEDDDYNCCQNDDDDDDGDCSGWYQHHDEAGDYNGWYQYHDEAGDYNSWYQHHEEDDEHNGLDQQYAPVQNLYLAADNHDHALNLTLNEAPSKNLNQNQPEEVAHTENLLAADNDDPIQNFLAANNHHPIQNFLAADNHNHNHACFCAFSRFLVLETAYLYDLLFLEFASFLLIEELEDKQRLIQKKITKLEQKLEDYKREMDVIDSHMENLSSQEVDDDEVSRNNEEDDDYNCCQNDDDDDDGDCSGWYQHHDEAGDYNGWYQYHDEADNHDHALNLTLNEAPSKNLNQNQPEEVAHTENLLAADNDDPIQNFLAANNHHPIQNFLAADNHNHNHACFCAFSRFLVLETAYLYDLLFLEFASFLLIEELEDKQRLIQKKITKLEQKLEDYKREMDVIDSHMENLSSQEVDDDEVSRNNEEDDDYNCCQNDDDDDDGDCSGWYQHHDEAGDYNGWYQYHDEAGDYNSWYQHHEEDDEHNGLDQQYAPVQNLYLAADNHDHALNLTLNEAPSKNLNQNQPEEVAHTENLLAADNDDPIQNFLAANNHHPIQNFLAADNHNHNHACFCAFSRFLVLETAYLYDLLFLEFASFLLIEELEDKQRLIQKKITKLEQKLEDYKREMDVIDSHMENLSSQEVDDDEVSRNNEEDDDYNCCQNDDDDDDGDCSGWYQHHDEAGDYNGWYQYHDEAGDYNSWYQHHEEDDEHNGLDQQYAPVQNLYLAADNHDHALNLTLNEAPSKNLNQNQPEEVAHTENLLAADNDDPIQKFLAANNHHPIQNFLAADNHNHNHACFCAFSRFLVLETAYLYDLLFLEFAKVDDDEVSRNNEEDDDYNCQNDDDDDDGDCSGWYQHHDEAGDYNGWYQYHDEADNHDHALNLTLNEAPSKNLNQNQPEEVAHTENLLAADNDDPIQNFLAANNHHPIQNFLAADNHNHNHACFCAFSRFLVLETAYLYDLLFLEFASFLLIEELEDKQRLIQKKITKLEQKLEDYKREMDVIDSHMENLSSQEVDDDEVSRNNEEDDDYNCCQNDDDDDDGDCSGWYQHHDEAGDYNGWYQYHDEAGDYNSWYQHHEEDDEHNGLDQQYAPVQNLYLAADNHDHALNLTLNEAPSKNLNQNQPEEVAHTENLLAADNDDPIQNFLAANNHHPIQNFLAADNHNHNHACFCAFSRFLVLETAYLYDLLFLEFASFLLIEELEDKQRLIQKKITKLEQKLEDYKREMDVIDSHMENLSSQEVDDDEVSRNNEEDDDYNCCQNDDDDDDGDCSGWYQHHDEAGDYNGWYQYHDEAGDYNSWYQHHEEDDEHNGLDQQYAPVQNLYLAADNHDHALNLTLNEAPSKNLNQNQPEEVAHTENLLAADNDDPIQNFLAANNHHPIQNFLAADNHNHNHACFCAFSRFLVLETAYLYDLLFLEFAKVDDDEVSRNNEEDDDYNCCQNDDDDDDGDCSGWYQHHDEAGDYNGWYQYHDEAGDYNSWYQHHEEDDEHNGLDQQYAPVQNLYLAADNHDHALNLTLNEAPSKNLNQNQPEEVAHTENLLAADNDDPIQNFLAANNHHPIQNFLAADNHNHNHACFCAFSRFLVLETAYLYDLLFLEFAKVDDDEVSRNNEEDDDYNCCQNDDDDDDGDCSGWYQHHDEAGDYNGWYQYHDEAGDYNSWYQHHEEDDEHNGLDQQYAPVQNLYLAADNHDHALNLTLNEAPSKNLNQNQPEEVAHTENLLAADNDDPIQNFLAANNHHPIQNFLAADNHNHNHACFCAFSRFLVLETAYLYDLLFLEFASFLLIEELEDKQRLIQKKITKLEQKLEDYKREMDVIDSHMENLSSQEVDDDEVSRNNEEDDDYNCCQNDDDDDDGDCSGWYQHHDEAGDYNGWYQYHDEAGDYNSWYQHHEEDDEHNGLDQQYAPVQNLYLAADNHDHALNLTLNEAPSKNLNQNQPEEVAHTENLLAADNDDPIQNFLAANNHHPIQNFLAADNHNHNHAYNDDFNDLYVNCLFLNLQIPHAVNHFFLIEVDDDEVSRNNEEDDDYNCCQNDDDDDDGDCSGWYQHHDEAGDYNGWYQYHDEAGDYNSWYQHHEEDDEHNGLDQQYAPVQNLYLAADNHDHALNLTLNEAPSKNLNQNQPEEVAHTENLLAADNDDPIQNFLAANNHHPIQNFLAADNHNHNHACFCAFSQVDDDEVSRNNEEDDDYNCCQNDDDDDDGDCSGWYQHHDEAGDYNGWYQYHDEAGDYNSWYQHHEEDDEHNGLDQQYAPVQNLYLAADNHDHALNLTLNEAPSKNLNQNQPEEVAHTENLLAADNDDPIQNFLAANNHHPIQNFLAADNHNHNHACFCAFSRFLVLETAYLYDLLFLEFASLSCLHFYSFLALDNDDFNDLYVNCLFLNLQIPHAKLMMKVSRNNEEDDDYNCCQNDDDDDDGDCSGWYQHHDEAGDYNGWYQYHDEAGDYNSWYQHHEEDDEHNGLDQQYAPVQNLYLAADNHDHALNLTLNEAPSKNLNQNQPEEVAHTENLLAADNDDPIQNFLAANNHHPIQNFLAADNHNHNHACFCAFSRFLVLETAYLYDLLFLEFAKVDDDEVSRNNEEDDDYNCCQNDDDDDDGDCSVGTNIMMKLVITTVGTNITMKLVITIVGTNIMRKTMNTTVWTNSMLPTTLYLAADNHDHALNLTLNEAPQRT
ncbi:hypothetical protein KIW84_UN0350 [Lathyrus oleraceus]|nr:hypothetical protein KIW84_UN0350 [Pisum sativum]